MVTILFCKIIIATTSQKKVVTPVRTTGNLKSNIIPVAQVTNKANPNAKRTGKIKQMQLCFN